MAIIEKRLEKVKNLALGRGFIFAGSEIYGGLANSWDYGPLGAELKNNIKKEWWKFFIQENGGGAVISIGMDGAIFLNPKVWTASGHVGNFSDPLMDCRFCKTRHRADHIAKFEDTNEVMFKHITDKKLPCPNCGKHDWTPIRQFNLMFKTHRGVTEDAGDVIYLRPETAQNQFVNFLNLQRSMRLKIPFAVGQIGKAFRNEITPGNFIFRTLEFEQMEYQIFCKEAESEEFYKIFKNKSMDFYNQRLGINKNKLKFTDHEKLSHYAKMACDMEYEFPFGFAEIGGTHHRGTYDLGNHAKHSGKSLEYLDPVTGEKFPPTVIESSHGADRLLFAVLDDAYSEEKIEDEIRVVLRLKPSLAPYKVAVLPLQKKGLSEKSEEIYRSLCNHFMTTYDDTASIGKRYRRQDEIGTPFCVTVDYDTLNDGCVTIRDRDTMEQQRIKTEDIVRWVLAKL